MMPEGAGSLERLVVLDIAAGGAATGNCELTYESRGGDLYGIQLHEWAPLDRPIASM